MSVSRMKNLIILVLSICAACLLAVAVPNRLLKFSLKLISGEPLIM